MNLILIRMKTSHAFRIMALQNYRNQNFLKCGHIVQLQAVLKYQFYKMVYFYVPL